ncbi:hypothetical protein RB614_00770 [Phytohabitans sp. ZYX-F-186]|uniref:Uncharacterized protein n=1 Tax=Phytohabitans maris TaxID=3071409 RepID=A0ABU0ZAS7_9ACTN|nr:hypothetical protein [Phytohabitans sp. ZYX-F-186]MDQ7903052.1 hypothetical protein [Phytohabitans sp. ZYX-F-186]
MSVAAPARRERGRLRGRLVVGLAFLAVLAAPGSAHAAPPPEVTTPVSVCVEAGVSTEIDAAAVAEAPAAPVPGAVEPRAAQAPVPAERVTVESADRSATGERAPPRPAR